MRCDDAQAAISVRLDGELPGGAVDVREVDEHVGSCPACSGFERHAERLRAELRFEAVDAVPDVAPAVLAHVGTSKPSGRHATGGRRGGRVSPPRPRRPLLLAAALAAIAGMAAGAAFVGLGSEPRSPAAADLPDRVLAAQTGIDSLDASFRLVAGGLPGEGGERRLQGRLVYGAPESLALTLREPGSPDADAQLVVDGQRWWQSTVRACSPAPDQATCPDGARRWVRSVTGREPFSESSPVPLELINPVDSFSPAASTPTALGTRTIAGRRAVGVAVTAAQIASFLDGLSVAGLRAVHPTDPVELWLDDDHLVPLAVTVRAGEDGDRARWASGQGTSERPGDVVLDFAVTSVAINEPVADDAFATPERPAPDETVDAGFRPVEAAGGPAPERLPDGFRSHRSGTITATGGPTIAVDSWTDGRAWLTVRSTRNWSGDRLFGGLGASVRTIDLGDGGVAYASDDGRKIALHTDGLDVVVSGSVAGGELRTAAAGLGVLGLPVPRSWDESATATLADAAGVLPGLLVAQELDGFGRPAVRIAEGTVTQVYPGAGDLGFALVQSDADQLTPPADGDAVGVEVRGAAGRYSPERGQLEWVEGGTTHGLSSPTLTLGELLAIAAALEPAST
ncbi:MAG: zf-HC2 domain-containing protein [Acidimicrobiales bacterium]